MGAVQGIVKRYDNELCEKQILLSEVKSKMSYFIYQIKIDNSLDYNDRIGELYLIEDAEQYFENGRLNTDKFYSQGNLFV